MTTLNLTYFSASSLEINSLSRAVERFRSDGLEISVVARTAAQLFDQARIADFVNKALSADAVIITLHGSKNSFPAFEELQKALSALGPDQKRPWLHIQAGNDNDDSLEIIKSLNPEFGTPANNKVWGYLNCGGKQNYYYLLRHINNDLYGTELQCPEAEIPPFEGIYHPDFPDVPELEHYLATKIDPNKITVGIWFSQSYWLNDNLTYLSTLIRTIEAQGANALAVFHLSFKDPQLGNKGTAYVAEHYFKDPQGHTRIDVLLSPMFFSLNLNSPECSYLLPDLNVPVLQSLVCYGSREVWQESVQGLPTMNVSISVAQPEFDGNIITVPFAFREEKKTDPVTNALVVSYEADTERTEKLVRLGLNWGRLNRTPVAQRKVAIIFHHYPPRNDRIGCAYGLDSFASVVELFKAMREQGYKVDRLYEEQDELAHELLNRMTCDRRWLTPDQMSARAEARADENLYRPWHEELPPSNQAKQTQDWGEIPGELFVHEREMLFAGLKNGNIFVSIQPPRGYLENIEAIYHDLHLSPPHHYLAQYRWIRDVWKAHAVIHVGKHGSLEWLPGKSLGLSQECYPDLAIMELPNIYPFIINNPGEGTQAKRRSNACIIDHLTPAYTNADLYDDLAKVESLVAEYNLAAQEDPKKLPILANILWETAEAANLHEDLQTDEKTAKNNFPEFLEKLHSYMHELSDTMIADGLHILGKPPEGPRLTEFATQLTRINNDDIPSLRESVTAALGFDYDDLLNNRGRHLPQYGQRSGADLINEIHNKSLQLVEALGDGNFDPAAIANVTQNILGCSASRVEVTLQYIAQTLIPNIRRCRDEIFSTLNALAGGFVPPGPSGAPSRGQADILPTGRNFYSVDPNKIPSPAAWEVGVALGDALLGRFLAETGKYPENVGILVYGSPTMRTRGDDMAEIFYLMGLKPVWRKGGTVEGLEVIPLKELGRPRIDVTPRVSGFFRDAFPNLMERIDEAVEMVARLKEPPESNYIRRHVYQDLEDYEAQGLSEDEAWREATFRVFSCPAGTYGAGVKELVESKHWETQADLSVNYIRYSGHAYGRESYGLARPEAFRRNLARMEMTVKNEDSRESDMMSCTDYYNYYGGLIVAAKTVRGVAPLSVMGDSSDPRRVKVRTTAEEAKHILRSRLVNPKWIAGLKRHGYKGAGELSHMMDTMLGWDATAEVMDDWMYEKVAQTYALDSEMKEWMKEVNPYALQNILDKLLEAASRGMWKADPDLEQELKDVYLEMEGDIEEWSDQGSAVNS